MNLVMSRETSAHIVNSVWLEIFVVSFLIGAFLANTGLDWFNGNAAFSCKVGESERGSPVERFGMPCELKSVQSALSDLLTTSATHGTFSRPSTKRGLILIGLKLNTNARESFEHC